MCARSYIIIYCSISDWLRVHTEIVVDEQIA